MANLMNIGADGKARPFTLPVDTVTSTLIALGGKGMGKTNLGSVIFEELTRIGQRWSLLDPIGVSWGLRHSRDGKGKGIPCLILGGVHGDIPIDPNGGAAVADIVIEENVNVIVDFSRHASGEMLGPNEKVRFCTAYIRQLFRRQGELIKGKRRPPIFQGLDEAARYIPQMVSHGSPDLAACVSAWQQAVEEGRNIGLGVGLWTLRSANISKAVTELADALFAFRTVGPNSLKSIMDWLGQHADKAHVKALAEQVRALDRGSCLVVSPGWLQREEIVRVRLRETFDSSATPKAGDKQLRIHGQGAMPDLASIRDRMKTTIETAKANDPKHLQALLKEAKTEIERLRKPAPAPAKAKPVTKIKTVKVAVVKDKQIQRLETVYKSVRSETDRHEKVMAVIWKRFGDLADVMAKGVVAVAESQTKALQQLADLERINITGMHGQPDIIAAHVHRGAPVAKTTQPIGDGVVNPAPGDAALGKGERAVLNVVAQYSSPHGNGATREQLSVLTGYKRRSRDTYLQKLAAANMVAIAGGSISIMAAGVAALGSNFKPLPTGAELRQHWLDKLPQGEKRVLEVLVAAYPKPVTREAIDTETGYARRSRDTYLQKLGARQLVDFPTRGEVKASTLLFN